VVAAIWNLWRREQTQMPRYEQRFICSHAHSLVTISIELPKQLSVQSKQYLHSEFVDNQFIFLMNFCTLSKQIPPHFMVLRSFIFMTRITNYQRQIMKSKNRRISIIVIKRNAQSDDKINTTLIS
jgi:hypothetical protein